jgi:hypothetical protein
LARRLVVNAHRARAVQTWLLGAAPDAQQARWEWQEGGVTFLRVGGLFSALRAPAVLVRAAVGSGDPDTVGIRLAQELEGGPVIAAHGTTHFFFLMLPGEARKASPVKGSEYLTSRTLLGVPPLRATAPQKAGGSYWAVPMFSPVRLCHAPWVMRLLERGRARLDGGEER